ncbi:tail fiber protein [Xylella phage Paz]|uniref:Tail fiber protein n=1 Tax=Xylella phage Paz TaxID=1415145 RepID=V5Q7N4_9CAUD|nr:tail fiber protein [Xylella phage Paz]AHB12139.1 tail fiber protein [Xylella phage Paz]
MIPQLTAAQARAPWAQQMGSRSKPLINYAVGGDTLGDSATISGTTWVVEYVGQEVRVYKLDAPETYSVAFSGADITFVSLAFDQSMRWVIGYTQAGAGKLHWFDSIVGGYTTYVVPGAVQPFVSLDVRDKVYIGASDVIISYTRDTNLYTRVQRERFATERLLKSAAGAALSRFGLSTVNRLQWQVRP